MAERLIDADALMNKINHMVFTADMTTTHAVNMACRWIEAAPTIEERKTGHWIDTGSGQECSACGEIQYGYDTYRNFCAYCGADMRGEQE